MAEKGLEVRVDELKINKENFRHTPLESEEEAIKYLIEEDYETYLKLAKMMAKDCRTFTVLLLNKDGINILMDGNRRTSVIKLFDDPKLIPDNEKYNELRDLCISRGSLERKHLNADVYYDSSEKDKENLMDALNELHIHDNKTKKDWNALSQYRASLFIGTSIKHSWIKTLIYYKYSEEDIIKMTERKTDIFARVFRRKQLNINEEGKIGLKNDKIVVNTLCKIIAEGSYYCDGKLYRINTRQKTSVFMSVVDDIIKKYSIEQKQIQFEDKNTESDTLSSDIDTDHSGNEDHSELSKNQSNNLDGSKKIHDSQRKLINRPLDIRDTIISEEQKKELSEINNSIVNKIACELFSLKLSVYPISSPIILRSFLQYSFEWYADNNNINIVKSSLPSTIMNVVNKTCEEHLIDRGEKGKIKTMINVNDVTNLLNESTHDYRKSPIPKTILIDLYDTMHPIIKIIYSSSNTGH